MKRPVLPNPFTCEESNLFRCKGLALLGVGLFWRRDHKAWRYMLSNVAGDTRARGVLALLEAKSRMIRQHRSLLGLIDQLRTHGIPPDSVCEYRIVVSLVPNPAENNGGMNAEFFRESFDDIR